MDHRLQNSYTLSVRPSGKKNRQKSENVSYEDSIRKVGTFSTVEQFWNIYSHMPRPGGDTLGRGMDFHLFKDGIKVRQGRGNMPSSPLFSFSLPHFHHLHTAHLHHYRQPF
mgnify:FL=1